jgi:hypothetical protein
MVEYLGVMAACFLAEAWALAGHKLSTGRRSWLVETDFNVDRLVPPGARGSNLRTCERKQRARSVSWPTTMNWKMKWNIGGELDRELGVSIGICVEATGRTSEIGPEELNIFFEGTGEDFVGAQAPNV